MARESETRPWGHLIAHQTTTPRGQDPLPSPAPTSRAAHTFGGHIATMDGTHRAGRWLAFTADYPGWGA